MDAFDKQQQLCLSSIAIGALLYCGSIATSVAASVAPSILPPVGIDTEFAPQFVSLGFDDNVEVAGIDWTLAVLRLYTNHQGTGKSQTFDGTQVKASFFPTCSAADHNPEILTHWRKIWTDGHEVGNHTYDHGWGQHYDLSLWQAQMEACLNKLSAPYSSGDVNSGAGIVRADIQGFRAPYVVYNDGTFAAMEATGLSYDVSIQEGLQPTQDAGSMYWPYTLDNTSPGADLAWWAPNVKSHPGIWSLPLHVLQVIPDELVQDYGLNYSLLNKIHQTLSKVNFKGNKLTAFDYNLFANDDWMYALTKDEALAVLKYNLDRRLAGNRAPLTLGFHTDYLSDHELPNMTATTVAERREVIAEFLAYATSFKIVRVVRHIDVINWMQDPSKLIMCAEHDWDLQQVYSQGDRVTFQGKLWTAKWWNRLEMPLDKSWSAWHNEGECVP